MPARWQPVSSSTTRARNELVDAMLREAHTLPDDLGAAEAELAVQVKQAWSHLWLDDQKLLEVPKKRFRKRETGL